MAEESNGPELGTRGLHSESGGGRGLTAWDAVCVDSILTISDAVVHYYFQLFASWRGFPPKTLKGPELRNSGPCTQRERRWEGTHRLGCCLLI